MELSPHLPMVRADATQMQIVMNLITNARDAVGPGARRAKSRLNVARRSAAGQGSRLCQVALGPSRSASSNSGKPAPQPTSSTVIRGLMRTCSSSASPNGAAHDGSSSNADASLSLSVSNSSSMLRAYRSERPRRGKKHRFTAGRGFAEVVHMRHNGRALGSTPVKLLVTFTGANGQPFTVRTYAPR